MNILLTAATSGEIAPFLAYLQPYRVDKEGNSYSKGGINFHLCITGVGAPATLYSLTKVFCTQSFDLAIQAGIAGAFPSSVTQGSVWYVQTDQFADLGAENDDTSFFDLFDMGFLQDNDFPFKEKKLTAPPPPFPLPGNILGADAVTVNTVSGVGRTNARRQEKYHPVLESMEGAAFHYVCLMEQVNFIQLRSVSNYAGIRDKSQWNIPLAIDALNKALVQWADQLPLYLKEGHTP